MGGFLEVVDNLRYLGNLISNRTGCSKGMVNREGRVWWMGNLKVAVTSAGNKGIDFQNEDLV